MVPIGGVEMLNLSWILLRQSMNSFIVLAGRTACTVNTCGLTAGSQIGTKSLNGSYGIEL